MSAKENYPQWMELFKAITKLKQFKSLNKVVKVHTSSETKSPMKATFNVRLSHLIYGMTCGGYNWHGDHGSIPPVSFTK